MIQVPQECPCYAPPFKRGVGHCDCCKPCNECCGDMVVRFCCEYGFTPCGDTLPDTMSQGTVSVSDESCECEHGSIGGTATYLWYLDDKWTWEDDYVDCYMGVGGDFGQMVRISVNCDAPSGKWLVSVSVGNLSLPFDCWMGELLTSGLSIDESNQFIGTVEVRLLQTGLLPDTVEGDFVCTVTITFNGSP